MNAGSARLLVVEDEEALATALAEGLSAEGFTVEIALDGASGLALAREREFDLILLDLLLPRVNGFKFCALLRRAGNWTPVLVLTAKQGELDEAEALDTGADDFLSKPFSFIVLVARVRSLLRRRRLERPPTLVAGDLVLDTAEHRCRRGATEIELTRREFALLEFLMRRAGTVVRKREILDEVWDWAFDDESNIVEVYVGYLRRKVDLPFGRAAIRTVRGSATGSSSPVAEVGRATVRVRITATALGVVGTGLVAAAVLVLVLLQVSMRDNVDAQARLRLVEIADLVRSDRLPATLAGEDDGTVAQVVINDVVVTQSPTIRGDRPIVAFIPAGTEMTIRTVRNPPIGDGETHRVAVQRVDSPRGPAVVYTAATLEPVQDSTTTLALLMAGFVPVTMLLVGITAWRLVGRTLGPVEAIRAQVAEISASALDHRVPVPGTGDEIDRLARTMNEMLDRLEASARRQRTFVADASHELRSPMAVIRTRLEVGLARPDAADWPALAHGWLTEQGRLERLVDDLLLLARLDETVPVPAPSIVDLDELVLRAALDLHTRGDVRVDVTEVGGGRVRGDAGQLRRVVMNLLDNAGRYGASVVRCALSESGGVVELTVTDDGPGVPAADWERIFERFVRLNEARDRRTGGAGLGLAIVRDIVTRHGGTVELTDRDDDCDGGGARFAVRLPAAGD
ncbi:ATP-binding response regulator [Dactylosporangium cerinum]